MKVIYTIRLYFIHFQILQRSSTVHSRNQVFHIYLFNEWEDRFCLAILKVQVKLFGSNIHGSKNHITFQREVQPRVSFLLPLCRERLSRGWSPPPVLHWDRVGREELGLSLCYTGRIKFWRQKDLHCNATPSTYGGLVSLSRKGGRRGQPRWLLEE